MEQETNLQHLFGQHEFIVFIAGGVLIMVALLTGFFYVDRRSRRKMERKVKKDK